MTDAIAVFPPGFRVTDDETGAPVSGAKLKFYTAGTTTPKTVYSTSDLTTTSLGSTVYTDSLGVPVASQGSNTAVMIYTGTAAYKLVITDSDDNTIVSLDNIKGAVDTSTFLTTGSTSTLTQSVVSKTGNYTIVSADRSKLIEANANGGQFTLTLDAASTLGDNWSTKVRNSGASNAFILAASQAIAMEGSSFTARAFLPGEAAEIICDGAGFKITNHTGPLLSQQGPGPIILVGLVSSAPAAPAAGARYMVISPFSTFSASDIIEANGSGFNKYTPPTDCGWLAYDQSSDSLYQFQGSAWLLLVASLAQAIAGTDNVAFMTALRVRQAMPARNYAEYLLSEDITTVLPHDDSIPVNTEGVQKLSATITPKATTSRIRVTVNAIVGVTGSGAVEAVAALFQDSVADALDAVSIAGSAGVSHTLTMVFEHCPATISLVTYKVRFGPGSAGTLRLNGEYNARRFGGIARSTLLLEEVVL